MSPSRLRRRRERDRPRREAWLREKQMTAEQLEMEAWARWAAGEFRAMRPRQPS